MNRQNAFSGVEPVRDGYELDVIKLQQYMESNVHGFKGPIELKQFKGGQSNPTYLISTETHDYVLRRKPPGKLLKSAHAVDREFRVITALYKTDIPVARTYALCTDESILGTWFYIMEYVKGRIFWTFDVIPPDIRKEIYTSMNETIARLHKLNYQQLGLSDFGRTGNFFERQIFRWSSQYEASKDKTYPAMESLIAWLQTNIPANDETSLVHGDFRLDNLVFHPTENRILAILDWELATLGHPLSDFSYHCMPWRIPAIPQLGLPKTDVSTLGLPTEEEYVAEYCRRTGRDRIENWEYYMAFNVFRLAAIVFGIKGRLRDGTATSSKAQTIADLAVPLSEIGLSIAQHAD